MDIANFLIWLVLILTVAGVGIGFMVYAYVGSGSLSVLFPEPMVLPSSLPDSNEGTEAAVYFQNGYNAYKSGNYRQAIAQFTQALQQIPTLAEAYHNRGLAYANLRQDDDSVINLLTSTDLYAQQENGEALILIKQQLEAIRARKLDRES